MLMFWLSTSDMNLGYDDLLTRNVKLCISTSKHVICVRLSSWPRN